MLGVDARGRIGVIYILRYIANIPKAVSLKIIETAHTVGYICFYLIQLLLGVLQQSGFE